MRQEQYSDLPADFSQPSVEQEQSDEDRSNDLEKLIVDFLNLHPLTSGSLSEFRKGRDDFDEWGNGILIGSKEWIIKKISSKLNELNSSEIIITRAKKYEILDSNLEGFSIRIMAKTPNSTIGYYLGRLTDDTYGLFGSGFNADEHEPVTEEKKKASYIEKEFEDKASIPIKPNEQSTLYQEIKNIVMEVASPTNITFRDYQYIVALGEEAVPATIEILRNPENKYGMADQVMLVNALVAFAKRGKEEAFEALNEIISFKIDIYNPHGEAQDIAHKFLLGRKSGMNNSKDELAAVREKNERLQIMQDQANICEEKSALSDSVFKDLSAELENEDQDIRTEASRLLSSLNRSTPF